jgi:hypothetical protein
MNRQGLLLDDLPFFDDFLIDFRKVLEPIFKKLFPDLFPEGSSVDSQKAFVVYYSCDGVDNDVDLASHFDNSEVTINVALSQSKLNTSGAKHDGFWVF